MCDLQTLNLALIYCHTDLNSVHINILCLSQVIFQDFLLKDQFLVPVLGHSLQVKAGQVSSSKRTYMEKDTIIGRWGRGGELT